MTASSSRWGRRSNYTTSRTTSSWPALSARRAMNFLKGKVKANGSAGFEGPNGVNLPFASVPANSEGRPAVYGIRPEHFTIADDGAEAEIIVVEPTGSETQVFAKLGGEQVVAVFRERHQFNPGDKIRLKPDPSLVHLFDETTGKRL